MRTDLPSLSRHNHRWCCHLPTTKMTKDDHSPILMQHRKTTTNARHWTMPTPTPGAADASLAFVASNVCFPIAALNSNSNSNRVTLQRRGRTIITRRATTTAISSITTNCGFFHQLRSTAYAAPGGGRRIVVPHQLQRQQQDVRRSMNTAVVVDGRHSHHHHRHHRAATIRCNGEQTESESESKSIPESDSNSQSSIGSSSSASDESSSSSSPPPQSSQSQPTTTTTTAGATPQQQQQTAQADYLTQLNDARLSDRQVGDEVTILGRVVSTSSSNNPTKPPPLTPSSSSSQSQSLTSPSSPPSPPPPLPLDYSMARRALWRLSWVVWWPQFTLTLISASILLFATAFPSVSLSVGASSAGLLLTACATILSLVSVLNTYLYTRLSRRMVPSDEEEPSSLKKKSPVMSTGRFVTGLVLALIGLAVATSGLHATTGVLLARLLTSGFGGVKSGGGVVTVPNQAFANGQLSMTGLIQPVDVLVVQAAANTIAAFVLAAVLSTWFVSRVKTWERKALEKAQLDQIQREVQQQQQQ